MNLLTVDIQTLCTTAETKGRGLSVTTHQIRNFYSSTEKLRIKWQKARLKEGNPQMSADELIRELILMKPKLAYAAARHRKQHSDLVTFYNFLQKTIDDSATALGGANTPENVKKVYDNFIIFMETIVAYHKFKESEKQ